MAKKKKVAESNNGIDDMFADIAEEFEGEILDTLETAKYFIDTGCLALNYSCCGRFMGGGIPGGRITEIYGPSASAKSLIGTNLVFGAQRNNGFPFVLDVENAINKNFVKQASHCDLKRVSRYLPETLERCFRKMIKIGEAVRKRDKKCPVLGIYDSITVSPCEREWRELQLPENYTKEQFKKIVGANQQPGERAKVISTELRKLNAFMAESDMTVVIMNQVRQQIGQMYGDPETRPGGKALEFYASLIFRTQAQKKIEKPLAGKKKKIVGVYLKMQNKKNRSFRPFVCVEGIPLFFDRGINPLGGLLLALLDADRIEVVSAGKFKVKTPWADGNDVGFESSIEKNDVPVDTLLACPSLIDAKDAQEIKDYLLPFQYAIDSTNSDEFEVTDVHDEDELSEQIDRELS